MLQLLVTSALFTGHCEILVTNYCYKPGSILYITSTGDSKVPKLVKR